jgi:hypothetical protein
MYFAGIRVQTEFSAGEKITIIYCVINMYDKTGEKNNRKTRACRRRAVKDISRTRGREKKSKTTLRKSIHPTCIEVVACNGFVRSKREVYVYNNRPYTFIELRKLRCLEIASTQISLGTTLLSWLIEHSKSM